MPVRRSAPRSVAPAVELRADPTAPGDKLTQAQRLVRVFNRVTIFLLVLTPVLAAIALWASRGRRQTLLQLSVGGILGLVIVRRMVIYLQHTLVASGDPANKAARQAIMSPVFHLYFDISTWLLIGLAVIVVVAAVTGPYRWAGPLRRVAKRLARSGAVLAAATTAQPRSDTTVTWLRSHLDLMRIAGVVLAVILLVVLPIGWIGALVIVVLLALYELWLQRFTAAVPDEVRRRPHRRRPSVAPRLPNPRSADALRSRRRPQKIKAPADRLGHPQLLRQLASAHCRSPGWRSS